MHGPGALSEGQLHLPFHQMSLLAASGEDRLPHIVGLVEFKSATNTSIAFASGRSNLVLGDDDLHDQSLLTVLSSIFATQMLAPSKATPKGPLPTPKVPN